MKGKKIIYSHEKFKVNAWRLWALRLLAAAVGLILLSAGFLKATDMELFIRQIRDYDIIQNYLLLITSAWGFIIVECALGAALLFSYRPRLTLPITGLLLLTFMAATSWAWFHGQTEDCGCFGAWVRRTPKEAMFEDLILLIITCLVWIYHTHTGVPQSRGKGWLVVAACMGGLVLPVAFGFPISRIDLSHSESIRQKIDYTSIKGLEHIDLHSGAYLIILMNTDCLHCQEIVPELNMLAEAPDLPPVIALSTNEESQRLTFVEECETAFPLGQVKEEIFWRLLANRDMPCIILAFDGHVQHMWDQTIPDKDQINAVYLLPEPGSGGESGSSWKGRK